ncbi:helix-turn-helix transcriptional regulator [Nonomuraea sp. K274]|uniref:Helix-turn-helix transcriptional regulator n=2 Tax=Nonomuraea cypriaca TaxID=1187855 RepID=A0A931A7E0_9ACTN|nr:TetR/AcrR family transcriptional regulator [Nonomuraea cypriaca]MBF8184735.1 helix-turn-helix transcriptional regulator [Nonomuraea cypriaca]
MAVAFTDEERARITAGLLDAAERLYASQGLKKTSLEELVAPAGISKASFYAFFDSKETLYKEVMIRRAPLIARQHGTVFRRPPSVESLAEVMRRVTTVLTTDPFYRRLFTHPDELQAVARRIGAEEIAHVTPYVITPLLEYIAKGQADGVITSEVEPEVVMGVMRTIGLIVMNRHLYGDTYDDVLDATINALARGLTTSNED